MSSLSLNIRRQLVAKGWAVFDSASDRDTRATLREFGELLSRQRIAHQPDARARRVEDESLRVCSGDPGIRWICWHAVSPDPQGAAILLNPVWLPVLQLREETKAGLREHDGSTCSPWGGRPALAHLAQAAPAGTFPLPARPSSSSPGFGGKARTSTSTSSSPS